jgi:hypothetical protein
MGDEERGGQGSEVRDQKVRMPHAVHAPLAQPAPL